MIRDIPVRVAEERRYQQPRRGREFAPYLMLTVRTDREEEWVPVLLRKHSTTR